MRSHEDEEWQALPCGCRPLVAQAYGLPEDEANEVFDREYDRLKDAPKGDPEREMFLTAAAAVGLYHGPEWLAQLMLMGGTKMLAALMVVAWRAGYVDGLAGAAEKALADEVNRAVRGE